MIAAALEADTQAAWHEDAVATIIGLARVHPTFTAEDLAREMRPAQHPNLPGSAFSAARTAGHITAEGYRTSNTPSRKNGVIRVWRRNDKGVTE